MENNLETKFREREEEEAEEETLSFCDLPLTTSDSADFFTEEQSFLSLSSCSSSDDTFFEFSISNLADYASENILFCGKLIPTKNEEVPEIHGDSKLKSNPVNWARRVFSTKKEVFKIDGKSNSVGWDKGVFPPKKELSKIEVKSKSKSNSVNWDKRVEGKLLFPKKEISRIELKSNSGNWAKRVEGKPGASRRRSAAPAEQQWPLLMLGSARFPASRRSSAARSGGGEREMRREKRLWAMVKALGCGGGYLAVA